MAVPPTAVDKKTLHSIIKPQNYPGSKRRLMVVSCPIPSVRDTSNHQGSVSSTSVRSGSCSKDFLDTKMAPPWRSALQKKQLDKNVRCRHHFMTSWFLLGGLLAIHFGRKVKWKFEMWKSQSEDLHLGIR